MAEGQPAGEMASAAPAILAETPGDSAPAAEVADSGAPQPAPLRGQYDAVVVGGGLAGLTVGCLLARAGRQVLLLESGPTLGGLGGASPSMGEPTDLGALFLPGCGARAPLEELARRLGLAVSLEAPEPTLQVALPRHRLSLFRDPERWWAEVQREFPDDLPAWRALFLEMDGLVEDRANLLTLLPPLPPDGWRSRVRLELVMLIRGYVGGAAPLVKRVRQALAVPFRETLTARGFGAASQTVFDAWLWFLRLRDASECSTLEAALALHRLRQGMCVVSGGMGRLAELLGEQFQRDGGDLRLNAPVRRCRMERGRVVGVEMATGATTRAPRVVADLAPDVLGRILPARGGWLDRRRSVAGPWSPAIRGEGMSVTIPEAFLPSELGEICLVVPGRGRPVREGNLVMLQHPARRAGGDPAAVREAAADEVCPLEMARAVAAAGQPEGEPFDAALLTAADQVVPGIRDVLAARTPLPSAALESLWGRPGAALSYAGTDREWLGGRGQGCVSGWPGLLVTGEWTYPGRLLAEVLEGAIGVAESILGGEAAA